MGGWHKKYTTPDNSFARKHQSIKKRCAQKKIRPDNSINFASPFRSIKKKNSKCCCWWLAQKNTDAR